MSKPGGWNYDGLQFSQSKCQLRFFTLDSSGANEWSLQSMSPDDPLIMQESSTIQILESRGADVAGIRASKACVEGTCYFWGIPSSFMRTIQRPGALPFFSYLAETNKDQLKEPTAAPPKASALNFCFRWGPGHSDFVILFARLDIEKSTLRAFLSSNRVLDCSSALHLLTDHAEELRERPLEFLGLIMDACERYVDARAQSYNKTMMEIGSSLSVLDVGWLESWHIKPDESPNRGATIYATYDSVNWLNKNCHELVAICRQYLQLATQSEVSRYEIVSAGRVRDVILRAELHVHLLTYLERMLNSQFSFYSNLLMQEESRSTLAISISSKNIAAATQKDSVSMKTVAYLTMAFLPATFVPAIFSTSAFDFQNWATASEAPRVASAGWWVFVLCCGITTAMTWGIWYWWLDIDLKKLVMDQKLWDSNIKSAQPFS